MKKIKYLLFGICAIVSFSNVYATEMNHNEIPEESTIIGTYLFSRKYEEKSTLYSGAIDTSAVMLGSSSIDVTRLSGKDEFVIYYKRYNEEIIGTTVYPEEWVNSITGQIIDNDNIPEKFDITHINGVCVDPICGEETYEVTFEPNANGDGKFESKTILMNYGDKITDDRAPIVSLKTGYKFNGWIIKDTGEKFDFESPVTEDIVLVPDWEIIEYHIIFDSGFDINDSQRGPHEERTCFYDVEGNPCEFINYTIATKPFYHFVGWSTLDENAEGERVVYKFGDDMAAVLGTNPEVTLYAVWEPNEFKITYNLEGGTFASDITLVKSYNTETDSIELPIPTKAGYTFKWWSNADDEENKEFDVNVLPKEDITLKANWEENDVTVTIEYGENEDDKYTCKYTECKTPTEIPANEDNKLMFYEWVSDNGYVYDKDSEIVVADKVDGEVTLTAKWANNDRYSIEYKLNGGTFGENANPVVMYNKGESGIVIPEPTKIGYSFNGWAGAEFNDEGKLITDNTNMTLTANWIENDYSIQFYDINSEIAGVSECTYDSEEDCVFANLTSLQLFNDENIELLGWTKDAPKKGTLEDIYYGVNVRGRNFTSEKDGVLNLYPVYKDNNVYYRIEYILPEYVQLKEGQKFTEGNFKIGTKITLPEIELKDGLDKEYVFVGWKVYETMLDEGVNEFTIEGATTVEAVWEEVIPEPEFNSYKLKFNYQDTNIGNITLKTYTSPLIQNGGGYIFNENYVSLASSVIDLDVYADDIDMSNDNNIDEMETYSYRIEIYQGDTKLGIITLKTTEELIVTEDEISSLNENCFVEVEENYSFVITNEDTHDEVIIDYGRGVPVEDPTEEPSESPDVDPIETPDEE